MTKLLQKLFCKHSYTINCFPNENKKVTYFCSECRYCGKRIYKKIYGIPSGTNNDNSCVVINRYYLFSQHKNYDAFQNETKKMQSL